ncbi:SET domain-containing protein [Lojkania enalia]|uniref:SET domain-containing protein n=1 Tax=Lojkania enalia TaxID=147567 RepID=A0A9P4K472_9PLEO|nr:SET domain-containing protein [Didymosphaeria enalia]
MLIFTNSLLDCFIGDASVLWKRDKHELFPCGCSLKDGCGETCLNRITYYECDSTNCLLTQCANRQFAELEKRENFGVEVMKTKDRGYGLRAIRTFKPHQIIVEYAGEIISQEECKRRMKAIHKAKVSKSPSLSFYLMSFNGMIIDATRGTIARFVNHSCEPNCKMSKWTVGGEPRMALFAGSEGIMFGEELTYDYNLSPFSFRRMQGCKCGAESCRGVLGPKNYKIARA